MKSPIKEGMTLSISFSQDTWKTSPPPSFSFSSFLFPPLKLTTKLSSTTSGERQATRVAPGDCHRRWSCSPEVSAANVQQWPRKPPLRSTPITRVLAHISPVVHHFWATQTFWESSFNSLSSGTHFAGWRSPKNFSIFVQNETLKLDLGQSEVSLKVIIPYYESWRKILRCSIYIAYISWTFENTLYKIQIVILIVVSIHVQV